LIAARALMGVGAAVIIPVSMAVVPSMFAGTERTRAVALLTAGMAVGLSLGPLLGGWLLERYWWGSVFLVNIPLVLAGLIAVAALLPDSADRCAPRLGPLPMAAAVLGLAALVYGVVEGPLHGWSSAPVLAGALGGALLLVGFVAAQLRSAEPMVDLGLF